MPDSLYIAHQYFTLNPVLNDVLARLHLPEMPEGFNYMYLCDDFLHHTAHYKQYGMYFSILLNYNLCENEQNPKTRN